MVLVGKALQLAALLMLPIAMFMEMNKTLGRNFYLADMLTMLIFGIVMFGTGRLFEGYGQPRS